VLKKDLLKTVSTSAKNTHTDIMDANTHFELRLHYKHNTSTVVKDSITHAYSIRLWVDHKIETWQPNDSTLVFYTERDANMSSLIVGSDDMIVSCELIKIKP
jgi:hypothetical protein